MIAQTKNNLANKQRNKGINKFNDSLEKRKSELNGRKELNFSNLGSFKFYVTAEQTID